MRVLQQGRSQECDLTLRDVEWRSHLSRDDEPRKGSDLSGRLDHLLMLDIEVIQDFLQAICWAGRRLGGMITGQPLSSSSLTSSSRGSISTSQC